jgi:predicted transcriptional regulator of viral defense system
MNYHGLTEQIPHTVTAITTKKVVTPSMRDSEGERHPLKHMWEVQGVHCEYVTVKSEHFFGLEEVWLDQMSKVQITDRERTMLEGFISPNIFGGMGEVLGILDEYAHELDLKKIVGYALQYGKASLVKRLGWSLEEVGVTGDDLTPLKEMPISGFRVLDPTRPHRGPCDKHWMIQNNLVLRAA